MSINDLPAIMGTVLIVAGLAIVVVSTWSRAEGERKDHSGRGAHHCGRRIPLGAVDIRAAWKIGLRSARLRPISTPTATRSSAGLVFRRPRPRRKPRQPTRNIGLEVRELVAK
jgi:hypothetical protein